MRPLRAVRLHSPFLRTHPSLRSHARTIQQLQHRTVYRQFHAPRALRTGANAHNGGAASQAVYVRKSGLTKSQKWAWMVGQIIAFLYFREYWWKKVQKKTADLDVDLTTLEDEEAQDTATSPLRSSDDENESEDGWEEDEDGVIYLSEDEVEGNFIPLQWPVQLSNKYYKGSDPEWQEFVRFSKDKDQQKDSRLIVAANCAQLVTAMPTWRARLGGELKARNYWLDVTFPDGPPRQYARRGFLLLDDEMIDSTQIMPEEDYQQLRHIMWPDQYFKASKQAARTVWKLNIARLKQALDMTLSDTEAKGLENFKTFKRRRQLAAVRDAASNPTDDTPGASTDDGTESEVDALNGNKLAKTPQHKPGTPGAGTTVRNNAQDDGNPDGPDGASMRRSLTALFPHVGRSGDKDSSHFAGLRSVKPPELDSIVLFSTVFNRALRSAWDSQETSYMPRGSCLISGHVEVMGTRGRAKFFVVSAWDVQEMKPHWVSVVGVDGFWPHQKAPKGGA